MKYLFVLNDSPYGSQRTYNALRLAGNLMRSRENEISLFLIGDGVTSAFEGFTPAHAHYNTPDMLRQLAGRGVHIGVCKTCLEERGIADPQLILGANRSILDDPTHWTDEADKVLVF
ncbi:MAG: DsrE family protein [Candidatus Korobacteraceae bacterium]